MKVMEIRYEKLVSLGNFNNVKASVVIALEPIDDYRHAFARAKAIVEAQIHNKAEEQGEIPS